MFILQHKLLDRVPLSDMRGRHLNRRHCVVSHVWVLLRMYCEMIPNPESHYSYSRTKRRYFENSSLDLIKLYSGYTDYYESITVLKLKVNFSTFRKYFHVHLEFGFRLQRSDVCNMCFV